MPRAGIEPTSPCFLERSANHSTIRDHNAGNIAASQLVDETAMLPVRWSQMVEWLALPTRKQGGVVSIPTRGIL